MLSVFILYVNASNTAFFNAIIFNCIYFTIFINDYIYIHIMKDLAEFVKERRKEVNLTQEEFAERAGVALTVVRKIEQGKTNMNMDKVNLVLRMFGHELGPVNSKDLRE